MQQEKSGARFADCCAPPLTHVWLITWCTRNSPTNPVIVCRAHEASAVCSHNCNKVFECVCSIALRLQTKRAANMVLNASERCNYIPSTRFPSAPVIGQPVQSLFTAGCDDRSLASRRSVKMSHPRRRRLSA
jgi:hypothetical protein